jgi:hypothetical protein
MTFMSISGKSIKKFKRVFIHWIDIESSSEWTNTLEGKTYAQNCYSMGWLAVKNKDKTIIFSSYSLDNEGLINDYGDVTSFPSSVIKKITYFKDEEEK